MQNVPLDGVTVLAVILIASFAIDRIVTGLLVALSFIPAWRKRFPEASTVSDPEEKVVAENKQKTVYFVLAAILGIGVLAWGGNIRLFTALHFPVNPILDSVITGLILVAGADKLSGVMNMMGSGGGGSQSQQASAPIEITGKLVLERSEDVVKKD